MRVGLGFDVHRLAMGRLLILGGVKVPYERGLVGHSDGDVLLHAITDALLGAAGLGDIGRHFPVTDPQYKGADSSKLLVRVKNEVLEAGYSIVNIDSTVIAQAPKLMDAIPKMREHIAGILDLDVSVVSVKAKTHEHLGSLGRGEGIAAQAVVLLND